MDDQVLYEKNWVTEIIKTLKLFAEKVNSFVNWANENQDSINRYFVAFGNLLQWQSAVNKLSEKQIVFTDVWTKDLIERVNAAETAEKFILEYYTENENVRLQSLITRCGKAKQVSEYKKLYPQIVIAAEMGCYHLACLGMFTLEDGILSDITGDAKSTSFQKRIKQLENKINEKLPLSDVDLQTWTIIVSFERFEDTAFGSSDFNRVEPEYMNRHWTLHGRSRREYTKADYIKMLLSLDALVFMVSLTEETENIEEKTDEL